jgi:hypothetical protein
MLRKDLPPEILDDVDDLTHTKAHGVVTLPRWISWSEADPTSDLSDRRQRIRVCEQVLREGSTIDVVTRTANRPILGYQELAIFSVQSDLIYYLGSILTKVTVSISIHDGVRLAVYSRVRGPCSVV